MMLKDKSGSIRTGSNKKYFQKYRKTLKSVNQIYLIYYLIQMTTLILMNWSIKFLSKKNKKTKTKKKELVIKRRKLKKSLWEICFPKKINKKTKLIFRSKLLLRTLIKLSLVPPKLTTLLHLVKIKSKYLKIITQLDSY